MTTTVAVFGAGQIGSRHIQALAKVNVPLKIYVVDPIQDSLNLSQQRWDEVISPYKFEHQIIFDKNLPNSVYNITIVIVATNSKIRKEVIEKLLQSTKVQFMILEKFLFTKSVDYQIIENILKKNGVHAWVNCPRRMYPSYKKLKDRLNPSGNMNFVVTGSNWGLGCNGIHMLDLFSYLSGTANITLNADLLDYEIIDSKRAGYVEFTGTIRGTSDNGDTCTFISYKDGAAPINISIFTQNEYLIIQEGASNILIANAENHWEWTFDKFETMYQSAITNQVIESLINNSSCELTTYKESATLHLEYLNALISFCKNKTNQDIEECLIT